MNPVTYAQGLVKNQGLEKALTIADNNVQIMQTAASTGATPYAEEVEMSEQVVRLKDGKTETRVVSVIDERMKSKRIQRTLAFWMNVKGYLSKRKPAPKAA